MSTLFSLTQQRLTTFHPLVDWILYMTEPGNSTGDSIPLPPVDSGSLGTFEIDAQGRVTINLAENVALPEPAGQPVLAEPSSPIQTSDESLAALRASLMGSQGPRGGSEETTAAAPPQEPVSTGQGLTLRNPTNGQFIKGNQSGKTAKHARQASQIRSLLYKVATKEEVEELLRALLKKAQKGDVPACKLCLEYLLGPPQSLDIIQAVASLESLILKGPVSGV